MTDRQEDRKLDTSATWRRARRSMRRLFEDLADLKEAGGAATLADAEFWPERAVARALDEMNLVRRMLRDEVTGLRGGAAGPGDGPAY